ncbi:hypothetical protein [Bradyrhizobium neotropicale]|uniref:hypothetical protein n=1 Tax=Bradyrhizobium neotropicale TaxID=1497615 RepID=UPI001AD61C5B|nr:hypothetical protein [Bradyrhizobium neotropicale]MBO4228007.1 hypothetical protein [Bradyrhizobium neotropicale]
MALAPGLSFGRFSSNTTLGPIEWKGGRGVFTAYGNFGSGGTCKLQASYDDGVTLIDVDRSGDTFVTFTANGQGGFELGACKLYAVLSGATSPSIDAGVEYAFR